LSAENPRLIHTSITGYGATGALASLPGFDPVFQARSGLMLAQGGDEPAFT
jgi:crotonobetainyl-CoA:carnitine CoA-transferase CaiB-like acyl-CoA transferase